MSSLQDANKLSACPKVVDITKRKPGECLQATGMLLLFLLRVHFCENRSWNDFCDSSVRGRENNECWYFLERFDPIHSLGQFLLCIHEHQEQSL